MSESPYLSVIRVWAALAWADGVIADAEATAMRKLIALAELDADERAIAHGYLESKIELEVGDLAALGEEARLGIYRAAARLAAVDMDVADEERGLLRRLREGLGISDAAAAEIEATIPGHG